MASSTHGRKQSHDCVHTTADKHHYNRHSETFPMSNSQNNSLQRDLSKFNFGISTKQDGSRSQPPTQSPLARDHQHSQDIPQDCCLCSILHEIDAADEARRQSIAREDSKSQKKPSRLTTWFRNSFSHQSHEEPPKMSNITKPNKHRGSASSMVQAKKATQGGSRDSRVSYTESHHHKSGSTNIGQRNNSTSSYTAQGQTTQDDITPTSKRHHHLPRLQTNATTPYKSRHNSNSNDRDSQSPDYTENPISPLTPITAIHIHENPVYFWTGIGFGIPVSRGGVCIRLASLESWANGQALLMQRSKTEASGRGTR